MREGESKKEGAKREDRKNRYERRDTRGRERK